MNKNKKYQDLLKAAQELFWKHGFKRVSIEEICKNAGVSKVTFYRFFPNKLEIAKAVFDKVVEEGLATIKNIMNEELPPAEKMRKFVQMKADNTNGISHEFLKDFYTDNELGLPAYIEEKTKSAWRIILEDFKIAQEKGWIRKDLNLEFFILFTQGVKDWVTNDKLTALFATPQDLILEFSRFFAYGISPRGDDGND